MQKIYTNLKVIAADGIERAIAADFTKEDDDLNEILTEIEASGHKNNQDDTKNL